MKILLLGAPGAGKGTQAKILSERLKIPIISMGDMLREMIKSDETLKEKVSPYMESGKLVPDEIVGEILKKRILKSDCNNGFILDGYPRNEEQAKLLEKIDVEVDKVLKINVSDEEILKRLTGRRVCKDCGEIFHTEFKKPKIAGICDLCSGELVLREDDKEETIRKRLKVFHEQTEPLERYYKDRGKFFVVDGEEGLDVVFKSILAVLGEAND